MAFIKVNIVIFILGVTTTHASNFFYKKYKIDNHIVHILALDTKTYKIDIVKANRNNSGCGTVPEIAKRLNADIAINGGFFDVSKNGDRKPSGTLIIKGHKYNLKHHIQSLLVIKPGGLYIVQSPPKEYISENTSILSGIPLLIKDNKILPSLEKKKEPLLY